MIIGYTTRAIKGNGIGHIYAAGWFTTFAHDRLLFMSQKVLQLNKPKAFADKYAALINAIDHRVIMALKNFMIILRLIDKSRAYIVVF